MIIVASRRNIMFKGIQRGWEKNNEGSKKSWRNVRMELRKKVET